MLSPTCEGVPLEQTMRSFSPNREHTVLSLAYTQCDQWDSVLERSAAPRSYCGLNPSLTSRLHPSLPWRVYSTGLRHKGALDAAEGRTNGGEGERRTCGKHVKTHCDTSSVFLFSCGVREKEDFRQRAAHMTTWVITLLKGLVGWISFVNHCVFISAQAIMFPEIWVKTAILFSRYKHHHAQVKDQQHRRQDCTWIILRARMRSCVQTWHHEFYFSCIVTFVGVFVENRKKKGVFFRFEETVPGTELYLVVRKRFAAPREILTTPIQCLS